VSRFLALFQVFGLVYPGLGCQSLDWPFSSGFGLLSLWYNRRPCEAQSSLLSAQQVAEAACFILLARLPVVFESVLALDWDLIFPLSMRLLICLRTPDG